MISRTGRHAVLALAAMVNRPRGGIVGAGVIAREIGAPRNYLGKLLRPLTRERLVHSKKGKGGGFRLARPAGEITLFDVVEPIEHASRWEGCFLGRKNCSGSAPCALHGRWKELRNAYLRFLKSTTVADVAREGWRGQGEGSGLGDKLHGRKK